jgi:hypothetical protein
MRRLRPTGAKIWWLDARRKVLHGLTALRERGSAGNKEVFVEE